jgi:hypothetical protein
LLTKSIVDNALKKPYEERSMNPKLIAALLIGLPARMKKMQAATGKNTKTIGMRS